MLTKKLQQLEKELIISFEKIQKLVNENIKLTQEVRILKERERYLISEIEKLKKNRVEDKIKKKLEHISRLIEKGLEG